MTLLLLLALGADAVELTPELTVDLTFLVGSMPDHRYGVQLGASYLVAVGDHRADPTGLPGSLWPLVGPRAAIAWRGNTRVSGEASLVGGIGSIETRDRGFVPYWTALGRGGVGFDGEVGLLVGGELSKSLSTSFAAGAPDPVGTDAIGLRFDFRQLTMSGSEQVYGIGLQLPASGLR